jgi:membrane protease YdiL (CAAX protease family)
LIAKTKISLLPSRRSSSSLLFFTLMILPLCGLLYGLDLLSLENLQSSTTKLFYMPYFWSYVIFGPIQEELIFRGLVLLTLLLRSSSYTSPEIPVAVISGVCFGLMHLGNLISVPSLYVVWQTIFSTFSGVCYSLVILRSKSIGDSILLHFVNNVAAVFLPISVVSAGGPLVGLVSLYMTLLHASLLF